MQRETNCAKQKRIWRTVALGLMAVTVVLAVVMTISVRRKETYAQRLSDTCDQSFGQLSGNVSNIATQLAKLRVRLRSRSRRCCWAAFGGWRGKRKMRWRFCR